MLAMYALRKETSGDLNKIFCCVRKNKNKQKPPRHSSNECLQSSALSGHMKVTKDN